MNNSKTNPDFTESSPQQDSVTVNILGTEYLIKGDADPDYIRKMARYVDEKMRGIKEDSSVRSSLVMISILAALDITDELLKEKAEKQALMSGVDRKAAELARLLDQQMGKIVSVGN